VVPSSVGGGHLDEGALAGSPDSPGAEGPECRGAGETAHWHAGTVVDMVAYETWFPTYVSVYHMVSDRCVVMLDF